MIPLIPREMEIDCETVPELKNIATLLNEMFVFNNMFNTSTLIQFCENSVNLVDIIGLNNETHHCQSTVAYH